MAEKEGHAWFREEYWLLRINGEKLGIGAEGKALPWEKGTPCRSPHGGSDLSVIIFGALIKRHSFV